MNKPKKQPCRKRNGKQVSFDFKLSVIDEINNGRISVNYASKKHNLSRSTIQYWMKKLGTCESKSKHVNKDQENKKLKERIEALEFIKEFQHDRTGNEVGACPPFIKSTSFLGKKKLRKPFSILN